MNTSTVVPSPGPPSVPRNQDYKRWDLWAAALKHEAFVKYREEIITQECIGRFLVNLYNTKRNPAHRYAVYATDEDYAETPEDVDQLGDRPLGPDWENPKPIDVERLHLLGGTPVVVRRQHEYGETWTTIIVDPQGGVHTATSDDFNDITDYEQSIACGARGPASTKRVGDGKQPDPSEWEYNASTTVILNFYRSTGGAFLETEAYEEYDFAPNESESGSASAEDAGGSAHETTDDGESDSKTTEGGRSSTEAPGTPPRRRSQNPRGNTKGRRILAKLFMLKYAYVKAVSFERYHGKRTESFVPFQDRAAKHFWTRIGLLPENLQPQTAFVAQSRLLADNPEERDAPLIGENELGFVPTPLWCRANHAPAEKATMTAAPEGNQRRSAIRYVGKAEYGTDFNAGEKGYRAVELTIDYHEDNTDERDAYEIESTSLDAGLGLYYYGRHTSSTPDKRPTMVYYPPARELDDKVYKKIMAWRNTYLRSFMVQNDVPGDLIVHRLAHEDFAMRYGAGEDSVLYYPLGDPRIAAYFHALTQDPHDEDFIAALEKLEAAYDTEDEYLQPSGTYLEYIVILEDKIIRNFKKYKIYTIVPPGYKTINPKQERRVDKTYKSPGVLRYFSSRINNVSAQTYTQIDDADLSVGSAVTVNLSTATRFYI